jgi:hypothetical protein
MPEQTISLLQLISRLAMGASLLALLVGAFIFLKLDFGMKAMVLLLVCSIATDIALWSHPSEKQAAWVSRSFSLIEFVMISIFFYAQTKRKVFRWVIVTGIAIFPVLVFFDALSQAQTLRDDFVTVCESTILLAYSLTTLYHWMKDMRYESITSAPQFWIVSAVLLYFGGNIFVFGSSNYAHSVSRQVFNFVWTIHASIALTYYLTITFGFWKARKAYR